MRSLPLVIPVLFALSVPTAPLAVSAQTTLRLVGTESAVVDGSYVLSGVHDGVDAWVRSEPVRGQIYRLYRHSWREENRRRTAWFLAAQDGGLPSGESPWWSRDDEDPGLLYPAEESGARGRIVVETSTSGYSEAFYVSPDGNDSHPGTLAQPLQTLEAVRQKVRDHKASDGVGPGGIAVFLRGGTWRRSSSFVLSSEDGGLPGRPVVWRAWPGETVRWHGAGELDASAFAAVTSGDAAWSRLPSEARGQVVAVSLPDQGIANYGQLRVRGHGSRATGPLELFVDERPMPLARWPDPEQHDGLQTHENEQIVLHGSATPDVSGAWTKTGTRDGVNSYVRDAPVNGVTYHLYRHTWQYQDSWYTAWFIAAQDGGYPGNQHPWWYLYDAELGTFAPANEAGGSPTIVDETAILWGFASIESRLSDTQFTLAQSRASRWAAAADPWFHGFWRHYWADQHLPAVAIDPSNRRVTLSQVPTYGLEARMPFYAENLLEEITRPGEWYLDRADGTLYWWPDGVLAGREILVSMIEQPILRVVDASHLRFVDLDFGMGRQDLVTVEGGSNVTFDGCRFFGAGNDGVRLDGQSHRVERSEIVDTGDRGVVLDGGDRASLAPGGHQVENSEIHRFGRWSWTYMPGLHLRGVGHRVAHNHLHDAPHSAILFRGNEHRMEYNEIDGVCRFSSDAGAIYAGRRWDWRGNRIAFNYIHDIDSPFPGFGEHGVYLDDCLSGVEVFGNLFVDISGHAMMHGGGRDDLFQNNISVRCGSMLSSDSRGIEWITNQPGDSWNLLERLRDDGVQYRQEPWCSTYPALCAIPDSWSQVSAPGALWRYPQGSVFSRNLGWQNERFTRENDWGGTGTFDKFAEIADNVENLDPRFEDAAGGDYRLRPDSPAFSIPGFVDLPFELMGILDPSVIFQDGFESGDTSAWQP